ncbi:MAG: N-acetyltransferase [Bacteroidetes bacterium]|uniref:N-acetyltransferase n=1 Tax=Candidatus Limisoma faecipullorum TaxID=2840854 RepID=A0A9D9IPG6_9BACT|nr:N-acetyltransferase [Candidatus Limisoma faecipullorum]
MIREVRPDDAAQIAGIYNRYILETTISFETQPLSAEDMRKRIEEISSYFPYLVAENNGKLIGYCYAHPWKERAAYCKTLETTIYLASEAKGKGLGTRLMTQLIKECRNRGYHALIACITAENEESCQFHERLGFKKVSHFEQVGQKFGRWLDVADYELML